MIRQLSKSTILKHCRMFSANRETPGYRLHHRQPGVSYSTIPSFLNLASISSMWMPIFSGSLSRPAQMTRRPSGVSIRPCSFSFWYCWCFSYSLFDICFMIPSRDKYSRVRTRLHRRARTSPFCPKNEPSPLCCRYPYQRRSAVFAQDQAEYNQRFDSLSQKFKEAEAKKDAVSQQISDIRDRRGTMEDFLRILKQQDGEVTAFNEKLWCGLLDYATAYADGRLTFTFKNGSTFEG